MKDSADNLISCSEDYIGTFCTELSYILKRFTRFLKKQIKQLIDEMSNDNENYL